jgi:hypothetical protein
MAKSVNDDVLDAALNFLKNNGNKMIACSAQPTTYTEANATYALADVVLASGDYTVGNGDTSGRKVRMAAKTGVTVDSAGTANHVAIVDTVTPKLLYVTTCASQGLSSGGTVDFSAWDVEIADPT